MRKSDLDELLHEAIANHPGLTCDALDELRDLAGVESFEEEAELICSPRPDLPRGPLTAVPWPPVV